MRKITILVISFITSLSLVEMGSVYYNAISKAESASDVRRQIVVDFLRDVISPKVAEFTQKSRDLDNEIQKACSSDNEYSHLGELIDDVYKSYAFLEAVKFGALADPVRALDIEINPLLGDFSSCIIDRQVAGLARKPDTFVLDTVRKSRKGLSAIEYLIKDVDLNHSCSAAIPQTKAWNGFSDSDKKKFRCGYLSQLSADLKLRVDLLSEEWSPESGDLVGDIDRNEMGNSSQDLLNQVADGLYFLERFLKDSKLATAIGLKEDCAGRICTQSFERDSLKSSMEVLSENLNGFLSVFIGNLDHEAEKKGFYILLKELGREDVALSIFNEVLAAKTATDLVLERELSFEDIKEEGYKDCLNGETSSMCDIFTPVQRATSIFKTDFYSVLNLRKPEGAPEDND